MNQPPITVVTPVLNQAEYIEQTIDSVLSQGIKGLEYVILDAGSTDGTVDIIKKYEKHLAKWRSHKDAGQCAAIHEGFASASGELLCWINSDDYFEPGALRRMVDRFGESQDLELCYGDYSIQLPDGSKEPKLKISFDFDICLFFYLMVPQPSSVWRKTLYEKVGGLDLTLDYSFDYDFFLRAGWELRSKPHAIRHVADLVSVFRIHPESKSVAAQELFVSENRRIREKFPDMPKWKRTSAYRRYLMLKTINCYRKERGMMPTRKDSRKA